MNLKSIRSSLSKSLKMPIMKVPIMVWSWDDAPTDLLALILDKKLFQKGLKSHGYPPGNIELFFHGQGETGPEDVHGGHYLDSCCFNTKITDKDTYSWEFKFPKKGFSIVVNWGA